MANPTSSSASPDLQYHGGPVFSDNPFDYSNEGPNPVQGPVQQFPQPGGGFSRYKSQAPDVLGPDTRNQVYQYRAATTPNPFAGMGPKDKNPFAGMGPSAQQPQDVQQQAPSPGGLDFWGHFNQALAGTAQEFVKGAARAGTSLAMGAQDAIQKGANFIGKVGNEALSGITGGIAKGLGFNNAADQIQGNAQVADQYNQQSTDKSIQTRHDQFNATVAPLIQDKAQNVPEKIASFVGEQAPALAAFSGGAALARAGLESIPLLADAAKGTGILGTAAKAVIGGGEGYGASAAYQGAKSIQSGKNEFNAKDANTTAAISAALPVVGALLGSAKEFLGKYVPEALVKSATQLKPTQKIQIAQRLEQMGESENVNTAEKWLIDNKLGGSPSEIGQKLLDMSTSARQTKLDSLAQFSDTFKDPKLAQFAKEAAKVLNVPGLEDKAGEAINIAEALGNKGEGATLAQIDALKTVFDDNTSIYNNMGSVKESARAKGLANLRGYAKEFIENEAEKLGVSNIKNLNQTVSLTRMFGDALKAQEIGAGGNAMMKLAETIVGTTAGSTYAFHSSSEGDNPLTALAKGAGVLAGTLVLGKAFSPENRIALANMLSESLSSGEAGTVIKFLNGERGNLTAPIKEKLKNIFETLGK